MSKNAFKEKVKEIQADGGIEESASETAESGIASPTDEQPSPR